MSFEFLFFHQQYYNYNLDWSAGSIANRGRPVYWKQKQLYITVQDYKEKRNLLCGIEQKKEKKEKKKEELEILRY